MEESQLQCKNTEAEKGLEAGQSDQIESEICGLS